MLMYIVQITEEAALPSFVYSDTFIRLSLGTLVFGYEGLVKRKKKFQGLEKIANFLIFSRKHVKRKSSSYHPVFEHYFFPM